MSEKKLFARKTSYLILAFIIALLGLAYCESAKAEWGVEYAHDSTAGISSSNGGADRVCVRYTFVSRLSTVLCPLNAVRGKPDKGSFEFGIADELWPRWEGQLVLNRYDGTMYGGAALRRIVGDGPFQMSIGGSGWISESPGSNSQFTFNLGLRYTFK